MSKITEKTIKKLFALSGNRCGFPGCTTPVIEGETVVAEVCHIRAESTGGPRFTASLSEKERNAFSNLLLLCPTHHKVVDDRPDIYTPELLDSVKLAHESKFGRPERFEDGAVAKLIGKANSAVRWSTGLVTSRSIALALFKLMSSSCGVGVLASQFQRQSELWAQKSTWPHMLSIS